VESDVLGSMLWFFKYFLRKNGEKIVIMQNVDHNIVFWEKRQFFRRKLQKIVTITSTPGVDVIKTHFRLFGLIFTLNFWAKFPPQNNTYVFNMHLTEYNGQR
jgi:hypothetical protein